MAPMPSKTRPLPVPSSAIETLLPAPAPGPAARVTLVPPPSVAGGVHEGTVPESAPPSPPSAAAWLASVGGIVASPMGDAPSAPASSPPAAFESEEPHWDNASATTAAHADHADFRTQFMLSGSPH